MSARTTFDDRLLQLCYTVVLFVCLVKLLGIEVYASWGRDLLFAAPVIVTVGFQFLRVTVLRRADGPVLRDLSFRRPTRWMWVALIVYFALAALNQLPILNWSRVNAVPLLMPSSTHMVG